MMTVGKSGLYGKKVSACLRELGLRKNPVFQWEDEPNIRHMYHAIDRVSEKIEPLYMTDLAARFSCLKSTGKYKTEHDINPDKYVNDAISMIENRYNLHLSVSDIVRN